ncbi:MAG: hypothetical protein U0903_07305 [Planctomycetales bacterium]
MFDWIPKEFKPAIQFYFRSKEFHGEPLNIKPEDVQAEYVMTLHQAD